MLGPWMNLAMFSVYRWEGEPLLATSIRRRIFWSSSMTMVDLSTSLCPLMIQRKSRRAARTGGPLPLPSWYSTAVPLVDPRSRTTRR